MTCNRHKRFYIGTFLTCFALLAFELFCSRVLAVVVDPHMVFVVIAVAMLGTNCAAAFISTRPVDDGLEQKEKKFAWVSLFLLCGIVSTLIVISFLNDVYNGKLVAAVQSGGVDALVATILNSGFHSALLIGAVLFVPYFMFGYFVATLFRAAPAQIYHRLYFSDLLGAAAGCIAFVVALEFGGYLVGVLLMAAVLLLAVATFGGRALLTSRKAMVTSGCVVAVGAVALFTGMLEPKFDYRRLTRDFIESSDFKENWRRWNSYTRVSQLHLKLRDSGQEWDAFNIGSGEGWALLPTYTPVEKTEQDAPRSTSEFVDLFREPFALIGNSGVDTPSAFASLFDPQRALVIFAGAGREMLHINRACEGRCEVTGVELNRQLIEHARNEKGRHLDEFYDLPNINLVAAEGREYLERDPTKYDSLLISWCGASISYYVGTSGHTSQFMYTKEAFESFLDHLNPNGLLIVSEHNKVQQLLVLRSIFEDRGRTDLRNSVIILRSRSVSRGLDTDFGRLWERQTLLFSPEGFTPERIAKINAVAELADLELVLGPDYVHPEYRGYEKIVDDPDVGSYLAKIRDDIGVEFAVSTDDRPYSLDMSPRSLLLQPGFWVNAQYKGKGFYWIFKRKMAGILIVICACAVALVLGPLVLAPQGPKLSRRNVSHLSYFGALGIAFMLVEVGLVQKLSLLFGNPGYSLSIVLAGLILATGVGSLLSERTFLKGHLTFKRTVILLAALLVADAFLLGGVTRLLLPYSVMVKAVVVLLLIFPVGILMGHLFPQGLRVVERDDAQLVPWAWAVNGAASTIGASLGVLLSQPLGFRAVIIAGACMYGTILLIKPYKAMADQNESEETIRKVAEEIKEAAEAQDACAEIV